MRMKSGIAVMDGNIYLVGGCVQTLETCYKVRFIHIYPSIYLLSNTIFIIFILSSIYPFLYLPIYLSISYQSIYPFIYISIYLSISYQSIYSSSSLSYLTFFYLPIDVETKSWSQPPETHFAIYLFINPSIYLSIYLS